MIYLDNSATTKPRDVALKAYQDYAENFGNASSQYKIGVRNKELIEEARKKIASCINASPEEIVFTSGGTESDNWVISSQYTSRWMVSKIEHPAMKISSINKSYYNPINIPVDRSGYINMAEYERLLSLNTSNDMLIAISVMLANNETGAIQPIKDMVEIARKYRNVSMFHTDAVQAVGHIHIDVKDLGIDMLSASGHKFGAFPGVGFLYAKNAEYIHPMIYGGHQERSLRGGTYNTPAIVGMADALVESQIEMSSGRCEKLRNMCIDMMADNIDNFKLNTIIDQSLPHVLNFTIDGVNAEEMVAYLDANEIYVSSGSACTSGDNKPSHVLLAMGRTEEEANSSIRISLSSDITEHDIKTFVLTLAEGVKLLRR